MGNKERSRQKKKLKTLFSKVVRLVGKCQRCGNARYDLLECSHVRSKGAHPFLEFDLDNALCLCKDCHRFFWHKDPHDAVAWFESTFPEQAKRLEEKLLHEGSLGKIDYDELIDKYSAMLSK